MSDWNKRCIWMDSGGVDDATGEVNKFIWTFNGIYFNLQEFKIITETVLYE